MHKETAAASSSTTEQPCSHLANMTASQHMCMQEQRGNHTALAAGNHGTRECRNAHAADQLPSPVDPQASVLSHLTTCEMVRKKYTDYSGSEVAQ